jgi:hypothetical protein
MGSIRFVLQLVGSLIPLKIVSADATLFPNLSCTLSTVIVNRKPLRTKAYFLKQNYCFIYFLMILKN